MGPRQTAPIMVKEQNDQQLLLQGKEQGYAWVIGLDKANGQFTGTLTPYECVFVLLGNCTAP